MPDENDYRRRLLTFPTSVKRAPAIETWMRAHSGELGSIAKRWFEVMRSCGDDVRELLHDGHPTACVGDAAFGYVNAFRDHVNVGFFRGAELPDPGSLLEGTGKIMRHVKLGPGRDLDTAALKKLIESAYTDMKRACGKIVREEIPMTNVAPAPETRRVPQFENERVKVWKSLILPGQPLPPHRHEHGRVIIALQGGTVKIAEVSGPSETRAWETGKAYWLAANPPGTTHSDVNLGDEPIEVIVVEVKDDR